LISADFFKQILKFKHPARTSRGVLTKKYSWIISIQDQTTIGLGECSVIPDLSPDFRSFEDYNSKIQQTVALINSGELTFINAPILLKNTPSILFGVESAFLDLKNGGKRIYFDNSFSRGQKDIPINGLIWMGDESFVKQQINEKISDGFSTIKLKISEPTWTTDKKILYSIREKFSSTQITLRVDANGSFSTKIAKSILDELNELNVHSIEQPIATKQWLAMQKLCDKSSTAIALDEELIGINSFQEKERLLSFIRPQFIILKPSLHGGISGTQEWIKLSEKHNINWWITSALESNIGLKTICDFTAQYNNPLPQGLGTGKLYTSNFETDLYIERGYISCKK